MSILQCRCVTRIGNVEAVSFFQRGQGSLLVAMSQTTLEKSTEESFSDDNVGGSPRAALPSSPTKDQPVSLTEAEGDSRAISPASSPFAPSSAPLSAENGLGRCSLTTQDSGVDETLDETIEEERARASVAGAKRKLCGDVTEKEEADYAGWFIEEKANEVFALDLAPTCSEPQALPIRPVVGSTADTAVNSVTVESSYPEHRESRLRRRRRRSRVFPPPSSSSRRDFESPKSAVLETCMDKPSSVISAATKHSSSDGDTKASVISAVEPGPCTSRTIAEKQRKAEALAAERSRERLVNFAAAEAAAEAARERARQQREARSQELKRREEERRRNADERRKALEMARQGRNVSTTGRDASTVTNPGLSKSLRVSSVHGRGAPTSLPRGFASELDPSDPRYCPYGFGSSCRREVCLTTSQIVKTHNDQNRRNILTTSFTADAKRKFHVPDKRMTTSATINYNRLIGGLDTGRVLAKHQLNKTTAVQPQSATAASSLKAVNSRSHLRKLAEIRSMRIPPSLMKSAELSSQGKCTDIISLKFPLIENYDL
ncbi:unnamed protein product [Schistocephalus solidus]|uniref:Uncharacterized protein n=1 Tax=Schistocephalus solidus TaxID=70667 RepID=A0A183TDJ7_SCHSO|nr:unnamed protein product [Schistocephalus solidus]